MKKIFCGKCMVPAPAEVLYRLFVVLVFMQLTRFGFWFYNRGLFHDVTFLDFISVAFSGGVIFDISAAVYFNLPYILMRLLPFRFVYGKSYVRASNWVFGIFNTIMLAVNISDIPFYSFTESRTQAIHVSEILVDDGAFNVVFGQMIDYWYILLPAVLFICLFLFVANLVQPDGGRRDGRRTMAGKVAGAVVSLSLALVLFLGIRGFRTAGRPLGVGDYTEFSKTPKDGALILNTPFSIIRTIGEDNGLDKVEFFTESELSDLRDNLHVPDAGAGFRKKNVMLIILEGVGSNYIKTFDPFAEDIQVYPVPLTPFLDSLAEVSFVNTGFYTNMRKSSSGITALLGGFPAYEPFVYMLSPYCGNSVDTFASRLTEAGYDSHFFCGCEPGSYNLTSIATNLGYRSFSDSRDYLRHGDLSCEYEDGIWGIYDGPMSKYVMESVDAMEEPFLATWFTLNTHSPFALPSGFTGSGAYPVNTMERCVEYIDGVLAEFFAEASTRPWYDDTVFIVTADHCGLLLSEKHHDAITQWYRIPMLIFTPDGQLPPGETEVISSQVDMGATILDLIGYPDPYFSLGTSIFDEGREHYAVFNSTGMFYIVEDNHVLCLSKPDCVPSALYDYKADPVLEHNLILEKQDVAEDMALKARAFIQDSTNRIIDGGLVL